MAKFRKGMKKGDVPGEADENENSHVQTEEASLDHEDATEGAMGEAGASEKSEDSASDAEHISHPRPEDGEEDQKNPAGMEKGEEEDETELEEDAEHDAKGAEIGKSLTAGDLRKSLNRLAAYANKGGAGRKETLLRKAMASSLNKSEQSELFGILGGKEQPAQRLAKSVTRGLENNSGVQKALDVSEYLSEQHDELTKSLSGLADHVERSDARQHEFNLVLAKAVADVGNLVKAMSETLGVLGAQPAHAPKSRVPGATLQKSFGGRETSDGDPLSKGMVLDTMEAILVDNMKKGQGGTVNGEDISIAISKFESFNQISPSMLSAVRAHAKGRPA